MDITGKTIVWSELDIRPKGEKWMLRAKYEVRIGTSHVLICPDGIMTDGASIPRFFWRVIGHPMQLPYVKAAIIHDAGYLGVLRWFSQTGNTWIEKAYTRKDVDDIFLSLMEQLGLSWWRRRAMYLAVRLFGGRYWTERD